MAVVRYTLQQVAAAETPRAVALGVFDGLHIGHRAVISAVCGVEYTDGRILSAAVLSMTGVPKDDTKRLLTEQREERLLNSLGVDEWIEMPFAQVCDLSPEQFVREVLYTQLNARMVCCGYNYRFGKGGQGTVDTLRTLCDPLGIRVVVIDAVNRDGDVVSSTRVRQAVANGEMQTAMRLLGRPFAVELPITHGEHRGHTWGVPTINQVFPETYAVPRFGVYASLVILGDQQYRAVTNVGVHPTVGAAKRPQAETWILGFEGELYDQTVQVMLIRFLREEQQFASVEALRSQIAADTDKAEAALSGADGAKAVLFDFDDTLQDRGAAFLKVAAWLLDRHMPSATPEQHTAYARQMLVENKGGYVDYSTYFGSIIEQMPFEEQTTAERLMWEYQRLFPACSVLYPETEAVLVEIVQRGYRIGLLTNGRSLMQNRKLDMTQLRLFTDVAMVSGDEGVHKPDPALFRRLAERLCVAPENCVFVGDHPVNDIQGALEAGMQAIYLNTRGLDEHPKGVPEVARLADILDKL